MPRLHLGVETAVYEYAEKDTAKVAKILENRYGLFTAFFQSCAADIASYVTEEKMVELGSVMRRSPREGTMPGLGPKVEKRFRRWINNYEAEKIVGVTKAAQQGIRHIGRHKLKGRRRPSFKDTSLLMNSFRAWVTK